MADRMTCDINPQCKTCKYHKPLVHTNSGGYCDYLGMTGRLPGEVVDGVYHRRTHPCTEYEKMNGKRPPAMYVPPAPLDAWEYFNSSKRYK